MNERIRELAEQAGYKPLPGFDFANSIEETYIKRFAELIVGECADFIEQDQGAGEVLSNRLKKHFGVEE